MTYPFASQLGATDEYSLDLLGGERTTISASLVYGKYNITIQPATQPFTAIRREMRLTVIDSSETPDEITDSLYYHTG